MTSIPKNINANLWTLADKIQFGGLGYSTFTTPTNFFKIIITVLFPPLGQIVHLVGDKVSPDPPYLSWDLMKALCTYDNFNSIIYSFIFTTLFYIPGLIYVLGNIVDSENPLPTIIP